MKESEHLQIKKMETNTHKLKKDVDKLSQIKDGENIHKYKKLLGQMLTNNESDIVLSLMWIDEILKQNCVFCIKF